MKKILSIISILVLLSCILTTSNLVIASDNNYVNQKEANNAALYYTLELSSCYPEWNGANIASPPVKYYSINQTDIAYEYTVVNGEKNVGFILISATKDLSPLLECSDGRSPSSYIEEARNIAISKGYILTKSDNPVILYWGALSYSVQFESQMKEDGVAIHLPTGRIDIIPTDVKLQINSVQANEQWSKLISTNSDTYSPKSILSFGWIYDVPAWYQDSYNGGYGDDGDDVYAYYPNCAGSNNDPWDAWDGCSAISGAMIHGYWDGKGYSSIPNDSETLIDDNHYWMNTSNDGITNPWLIDDGIGDVFDRYGYGDDFSINNTTSTVWSDIMEQVDAGYPSVVSFLGGTYGGHSSTLMGYYTDYNLIVVHDTWDTGNLGITYGDWTICQMTKVEPN